MKCPTCLYAETKVIDSRDTNDGKAIRRRRECDKCGARFSTYEEVEIMRLAVVKRNKERQEYDQQKISEGIERALKKRPVSREKKEKLINEIEYEIYNKSKKGEINSKDIGKIILEKLKNVDKVAYLRFVSVYRSFGSLNSFQKEVDKLKDK